MFFGLIAIPVTPIRETVIEVEPLIAPWLAVMVAVPGEAPCTTPSFCPTEAIFWSEVDQNNPEVNVWWLLSSKVPVALICKLLPCWMLAFGGPTVIVVN